MMRPLTRAAAACASLALVAALYACSSSERDATGANASADAAAAGDVSKAGPVIVDNDAQLPTSVCAPGPGLASPTWKAPSGRQQGQCTQAQIADLADCAYGHAGFDANKCDAFNKAAANAACIACAKPPASAATSGALVSTGTVTNVNYAGCVALFTGDETSTGCGAKIQAADQCREAACAPSCPVSAGNAQELSAFSECMDDAWTSVCVKYAAATNCADSFRADAGVASPCYALTSDPGANIRFYVDLFCGPASLTDGGADAPEGG